jgi:hypothetical protein
MELMSPTPRTCFPAHHPAPNCNTFSSYQSFAAALQRASGEPSRRLTLSPHSPAASSLQLWIALPQCFGGVPVPPAIDVAVSLAEKALLLAMNSSSSVMFFGGHSLGGAMVQTLSQSLSAAGLLLTGSFLSRKWILPFT